MNDLARTEQHAALRHRRITGSRAKIIMTGGPQAWDKLSDTLRAAEPEKFFTLENTPNMPDQLKRGLEYEDQARGEFFFQHDEYEIVQPTFCVPAATQEELDLEGLTTYGTCGDTLLDQWIGVSPDAMLVYGEAEKIAGLELKVPLMEKHLEWREAGVLPAEYMPQVMISILVTSADHWWFCSFCPELEGEERYFEVQVPRETSLDYLGMMTGKLHEFLEGHINHQVFGATLEAEPEVVEQPDSEFPVVNYGITEVAIQKLNAQYGEMDVPTNSSTYAVVKAANLDLVRRRTGIDRARKAANAEAQKYITGVNGEAKRLTGMLADTEAHTKTLRTDWEDEAQRKKDEAEAAEAARVEYLQMCVDAIGLMSEDLHTMTSDEIAEQKFQFSQIGIGVGYEEFQEMAQNALEALLYRTEKIRIQVVDKEEKAAEAAHIQADKDAELERLQQEAKEREKKDLEESRERERLGIIRDRMATVGTAALAAMSGDLDECADLLAWLKSLEINEETFGDSLDRAVDYVPSATAAVEKIIAGKQRDLAAIEAERQKELDDEKESAKVQVVAANLELPDVSEKLREMGEEPLKKGPSGEDINSLRLYAQEIEELSEEPPVVVHESFEEMLTHAQGFLRSAVMVLKGAIGEKI